MRRLLAALMLCACIAGSCAGCGAQGFMTQFTDEMGDIAAEAPLEGATYYLRVDNECVAEDESGDPDMPYRYELTAWSEEGAETTVIFRTARVLQDGAYLRFDATFLRGMISWEEVSRDEMPDAVQRAMGVV